MKLISNHELSKCSDGELSALFCTVWNGLVRTQRGSAERRNALATLENIARARRPACWRASLEPTELHRISVPPRTG